MVGTWTKGGGGVTSTMLVQYMVACLPEGLESYDYLLNSRDLWVLVSPSSTMTYWKEFTSMHCLQRLKFMGLKVMEVASANFVQSVDSFTCVM